MSVVLKPLPPSADLLRTLRTLSSELPKQLFSNLFRSSCAVQEESVQREDDVKDDEEFDFVRDCSSVSTDCHNDGKRSASIHCGKRARSAECSVDTWAYLHLQHFLEREGQFFHGLTLNDCTEKVKAVLKQRIPLGAPSKTLVPLVLFASAGMNR
mmetsp:Transcript_3211/g.4582  ORF Transcript_3211/g.4582 Transcript_3211/m.4582 type:complete len:155 (-) Transcript_3211:1927-2391(-)